MSRLFRFVAAVGLFVLPAAWFGSHASYDRSPAALYAAASLQILPGMPPLLNPHNIYSAAGAGMLSAAVSSDPHRIYVPNSKSDSVDIIDPGTCKIIGHFALPKHSKGLLEPQHIVPSWDLKKLWVAQDLGDQLTLIDPVTGQEGETIHVDDPYNMYYTPDGKYAVVMAEREKRLDFRDAQSMSVVKRVPVNCKGVNHADFSPDGRYMIATCEFSDQIIKVDIPNQKVVGEIPLEPAGMPQDCRIAPDGKMFYIADMHADGVHVIDGDSFRQIEFIKTGRGAHGEYFSRDAKYMYVSNRGDDTGRSQGSISLIDLATRKVATKWVLPGYSSPDMGGVSIDGKTLWLSGRYNNEVYAIDTADGKLKARINVGRSPHGLCVWPQPGRYSLGHTGNMR
jgi:YVTN family beta-propeller protein